MAGEAWISSGPGSSIRVNMSSAAEIYSVPVEKKKNATSREKYSALKKHEQTCNYDGKVNVWTSGAGEKWKF